MVNFKTVCASLCLAAILSSCATDVANRYYADQKYSPVPVAQVQLLRSKPDRPFEVIADFQSRGETAKAMREKAAAIGADAVIVTIIGGSYSLFEDWADQDRNASNDPRFDRDARITGTAIKFTK